MGSAVCPGNVEYLQFLKAHVAKLVIRRHDIWTLAPGTTSTIEHDELRPRQRFGPLAKFPDAFGTGGRTDIFRSRDVRLSVEHMGTNLKDERLVTLGRLQDGHQFSRLN
jgi:hypothetical protein